MKKQNRVSSGISRLRDEIYVSASHGLFHAKLETHSLSQLFWELPGFISRIVFYKYVYYRNVFFFFQGVRSEIQKRLPKEWSEEEVAQLTELWEQVKEEDGT